MSDLAYSRVQAHLARLKLPRMADCLDMLAEEAAKHEWTYLDFLDHLLESEVSARYERDVAMKIKLAHFPFLKTLEQFDFAFQPSISERQVRELATLRFIANGENVLLLGPPGVGKTQPAYYPSENDTVAPGDNHGH
jgi:DNA replication protein DnaC